MNKFKNIKFNNLNCLIVDRSNNPTILFSETNILSHGIVNKLKVEYFSKENIEIWQEWEKRE